VACTAAKIKGAFFHVDLYSAQTKNVVPRVRRPDSNHTAG